MLAKDKNFKNLFQIDLFFLSFEYRTENRTEIKSAETHSEVFLTIIRNIGYIYWWAFLFSLKQVVRWGHKMTLFWYLWALPSFHWLIQLRSFTLCFFVMCTFFQETYITFDVAINCGSHYNKKYTGTLTHRRQFPKARPI